MATRNNKLKNYIRKLNIGSAAFAHLTNKKWMSYRSVIKPGLLYPFPTHQCSTTDLAPIQKIIDWEILYTQNLNASFLAVMRGPLEFGGLGIPDLHSENLSKNVIYLLHHICRDDNVIFIRKPTTWSQYWHKHPWSKIQWPWFSCNWFFSNWFMERNL